MVIFFLVFFGAAFMGQVATLAATRLGRRYGLVDRPGARKVHATPIPRIGGVAIMVSTVVFSFAAMGCDNTVGLALRKIMPEVMVLLGGGLMVFLVGLWDDIRPRPAVLKLIVLTVAAAGVAVWGGRIETLSISPGRVLDMGGLSWPVTLLWIIGATVAMNFIDGLDGLAAGIALVVCGVIATVALLSGQIVMAVLMLAMTGSLTGFLFFNFNPAKVFMGDCGSMFLGFMIGSASVICQAKTSTLVGFALPALAMGLPIGDTLLTLVRRKVLDRRSIFAAERGHIHHRLLDKGFSQKAAVLSLYAVTLLVAGLGLLMLLMRGMGQLVVLGASVMALMLAFRVAGAGRLRETLAALHRNSAMAHAAKQERHDYDDVQLELRQAHTLDAWWHAAESLAEKMEFDRLAMDIEDSAGPRHYHWVRRAAVSEAGTCIDVELRVATPSPQQAGCIHLVGHRNGSVEAFGRRLSLFGRMIDETPPPLAPATPQNASVVGSYESYAEAPAGPRGKLAHRILPKPV